MGELSANFKGYDVQAARREAREKVLREGHEEERREWIKKIMSLGSDHSSGEDDKVFDLFQAPFLFTKKDFCQSEN